MPFRIIMVESTSVVGCKRCTLSADRGISFSSFHLSSKVRTGQVGDPAMVDPDSQSM